MNLLVHLVYHSRLMPSVSKSFINFIFEQYYQIAWNVNPVRFDIRKIWNHKCCIIFQWCWLKFIPKKLRNSADIIKRTYTLWLLRHGLCWTPCKILRSFSRFHVSPDAVMSGVMWESLYVQMWWRWHLVLASKKCFALFASFLTLFFLSLPIKTLGSAAKTTGSIGKPDSHLSFRKIDLIY